MDSVYLIAAGYEWTCPHCDIMNTEIEFTPKVTCLTCKQEFRVADADHAYGMFEQESDETRG